MTNNFDGKLFIELGVKISQDVFKRNIIVIETEEAIELHRKQYNNTDVYRTIYSYDNKEIRLGKQRGHLSFDLDNEENPQSALDDSKKLVDYLERQGCPKSAIRVWFSGHKGIHIQVLFESLGIEPSETLNETFKIIASDIKSQLNLTTLDLKVYDKVRLWRLENSIHGETGYFKIPLYLEEIYLPIVAIREMAQTKRLDNIYK